MKNLFKLLLLTLILFSFNFLNAQGPYFEWAKSMGSSGLSDYGASITTDALGNVYSTGYFQNTVDFDPGPGTFNLTSNGTTDIYIQKLDASGNFVWAKSMGSTVMVFPGTGNDAGEEITIDHLGNLYVTGYFTNTVDFDPGTGVFNLTSNGAEDIFILKLDVNGNFVWAKSMGSAGFDDYGASITTDSVGNVYATGGFQNTVDFDPGSATFNLTSNGARDIFIQKLDSNGNFVWAHSWGSIDNDFGRSLEIDVNGNIIAALDFRNTVDFDPGLGTFNLTSNGDTDGVVLKLDSNGNFIWVKSFGSSGAESVQSINIDIFGNILACGLYLDTVDFDPGPGIFDLISNGSNDMFIQKLDSGGNFVWAVSFGSMTGDNVFSITTDAIGNVYSTGRFQNTVDFDPGPGIFNLINDNSVNPNFTDAFIQKLDANGDFIWAISLECVSSSLGQYITLDPSSNIYTTGVFFDTTDFDPGPGTFNVTSNGGYDVFIHKLSQCIVDSSTDIISACDSVTWIDGVTYTSSNNNATYTLTNSNNCDSIVTLDLTITHSTFGTDIQTACDSFLWIDGNTYTSSNNTATYTLTNAANCDSIVTLDLTITNSTFGTDIQTACDSFTWIDGNTYTSSNNSATYTLTNAANCDSVVTLNLTITDELLITDVQTACDSFLWIDGNTYTSSNNTATYTLSSTTSCDTIVTLDLTITSIDNTVFDNSPELSAAITGATYQWLDCSNGFAPISGEINQSYTAVVNGSYAVEITQNGCIDTSACYTITLVSDFIVVPNGFTPDGLGDPENNFFYPITNPNGTIDILGVTIFNRWGTKIYDNSAPPGWDGTYKGERQPIGTYVYIINYVENGQLKQISGDISILN